MILLSGFAATINWHWVWLIVAAFLAGVLNAVAGGGSFLLFPAMLSMGMLPIQANASNTLAVWPGQLTSIAGYRKDVRRNLRLALIMACAGLLGGASGATVLLGTPQLTFLRLVPWLLLSAATIFAISGPVTKWLARRKPAAQPGEQPATAHPARLVILFLATALVSFYIGYFGAGAGFLIITLLSFFGFQDIHDINAMKVVTATTANGVAFCIFIVRHQAVWKYCLLAMVVSAIGGYMSASMARRVPQPVLRMIVVIVGLSMAAWFFYTSP